MMASIMGHYTIVSPLLNANANPNHQNDKGMTPLMTACLNCHPRIFKLLLTRGADPNLKDSNNSTALMFAQHKGCSESAYLLLSDSFAQTPGLDMIDEGTYTHMRTHTHMRVHTHTHARTHTHTHTRTHTHTCTHHFCMQLTVLMLIYSVSIVVKTDCFSLGYGIPITNVLLHGVAHIACWIVYGLP